MEDLAIFTALHHLGSFGKNFVSFKKNNKYVIYRLRVGLYGFGQHFQDRGHSFSPYGPTLSREITYIYFPLPIVYSVLRDALFRVAVLEEISFHMKVLLGLFLFFMKANDIFSPSFVILSRQ